MSLFQSHNHFSMRKLLNLTDMLYKIVYHNIPVQVTGTTCPFIIRVLYLVICVLETTKIQLKYWRTSKA